MQQEKELDKPLLDDVYHGRRIIVSERKIYTLKGLEKVYYIADVEIKNPELANDFFEHMIGQFTPFRLTAGLVTDWGMTTIGFSTELDSDFKLKDVIKEAKHIADKINELYGENDGI